MDMMQVPPTLIQHQLPTKDKGKKPLVTGLMEVTLHKDKEALTQRADLMEVALREGKVRETLAQVTDLMEQMQVIPHLLPTITH